MLCFVYLSAVFVCECVCASMQLFHALRCPSIRFEAIEETMHGTDVRALILICG